jgi:hypothetical protein
VRVRVLYIASPHPSPNQVQRGDGPPQRAAALYIASPHPSPNQVQRGYGSPQRAAARRARTNAAAPRARYGRCLGRCRGGNNEPTPRVKRAARGPSRTRTSHEKVWIGPPQSEGQRLRIQIQAVSAYSPSLSLPYPYLTLCRRGTSESLGILVRVRTTLPRTPTVTPAFGEERGLPK